MQTLREQYRRYALFVLLTALGIAVFVKLTPFLGGLLGAATIYILLRGQMWHLTEQRKWRRSLAATLLLSEAVLCFLVPLSLLVWLAVVRMQHVAIDPHLLVGPLERLSDLLRSRVGYDLMQESNLAAMMSYIPKVGQWLVSSLFSFAINVIVLLFVLYFMLLGGCRMEEYIRGLLPFDRAVTRNVLHEVHMIVRSNAIGIPLLAVVQGIVAYLGYVTFGVPGPLFWGLITCFATIIPLIGTAIVWTPLAWYLMMEGDWGAAAGLLLFGVLVITQIDNVLRFVMQRKLADTHPLVTIFGVVIGLSLFGFMGVIFGPLLLAMFIFCVDLFKKRYLDGTPDAELFPDSSDD